MAHVVKDPLGTKGARLTIDITLLSLAFALPSVYAGTAHVWVAPHINSEAEREA